eukprot:CAMPEP_0172211208 /NCGR_PEP_ID=MMETSP1050-20130122/36270_1 /TAXON_ID=233186 /ORGANISM="Cryptomonas curvata, Strain CCAP979/52" /LENGTH=387 /DNA_ID=CAMNT_0012891625 /DNA_START=1 /DNA_END=1161 /DNA_ORIENTATION=+
MQSAAGSQTFAVCKRRERNQVTTWRRATSSVFLMIAAIFLVNRLASAPQKPIVELKIDGIERETQDQIDSGEWPLFMVKDMMKKGLLPPHSFDEDEESHSFNVPDDDGKKKKKSNKPQSGINGTNGNSSQEPANENSTTSTGREVGKHVGVPGHCEKDPHITCNSFDDCRAVTGTCIWWYCTVDVMKACQSTNDCGEEGGICSGPGYCQEFPEAACQIDRDCEAFGGSCVVGGYCLQSPNFSCLDDIDCNPDDSCSFHEPQWWRADSDFPQDRDEGFGPYPNWTDRQLRQKMMIAMRKIVHMQHDLEQQVPINTRLSRYIRRVRANQTLWERVGPALLDSSQEIMRSLTRNASARISVLVEPVNRSIFGFVSALVLHGRNRTARADR